MQLKKITKMFSKNFFSNNRTKGKHTNYKSGSKILKIVKTSAVTFYSGKINECMNFIQSIIKNGKLDDYDCEFCTDSMQIA